MSALPLWILSQQRCETTASRLPKRCSNVAKNVYGCREEPFGRGWPLVLRGLSLGLWGVRGRGVARRGRCLRGAGCWGGFIVSLWRLVFFLDFLHLRLVFFPLAATTVKTTRRSTEDDFLYTWRVEKTGHQLWGKKHDTHITQTFGGRFGMKIILVLKNNKQEYKQQFWYILWIV